jgi:uncharacterized protein (DUF58 family)
MDWIKKYLGDLFLQRRFFLVLAGFVIFFLIAFYFSFLQPIVLALFFLFLSLCVLEYSVLFYSKNKVAAQRIMPNRFSNGDENIIVLNIKNDFLFPVHVLVIDELPVQLQIRDWRRSLHLQAREQKNIRWQIKPMERGEYHFGDINLFVSTVLFFLSRRFTMPASKVIPVYPSFMQLRRYDLFSGAILKAESGSRRIRRIGVSMEFEQIKDYVPGDDIRTVNWKASARRGGLMVNSFMEERSQQVYCIIDKGRLMKMPFGGMTLLDYAINSCLVLSDVCLRKQDKVGLITFSNVAGTLLAADSNPSQAEKILQLLYKEKTDFLESDFEMLYAQLREKIRHRSLLILFTNFESLSGLNRQMQYLRSLGQNHLLLVVFFENSELQNVIHSTAQTVEEIYNKTVAEKFDFEKRLISKELSKYGILSILSSPKNLTINTINKYLELKERQAI